MGVALKLRMYQRKVDLDMLNAVKSVLADVSSVSPSSEQRATLRYHFNSNQSTDASFVYILAHNGNAANLEDKTI